MSWAAGAAIVIGIVWLAIHYARKEAVKAKEVVDLEQALRRDAESRKKGAAIDAEVASSRNALRRWLRFKKQSRQNRANKPLP